MVVDVSRRSDRDWPRFMFAARLAGHDFDGRQVGVWAIKGDGGGPIWAVDSIAREWSQWAADAQPGSPAMDDIERIAGYPETRAARDAVRGLRT